MLVGHDLDSVGQQWLHTHVIYGALARAGKAGPGGLVVVDRARVEALAPVLTWGYHLLVRHQLTDLLEALGLGWSLPAADGSCEVLGLSEAELAVVGEPARSLGEINACRE